MKKLNVKTENKLEAFVKKSINADAVDYSDVKGRIEDILNHGCQSGTVGELIYYKDTCAFFKKYKTEINQLLSNAIAGIGNCPKDVFGDKWDDSDPMCMNDQNQNLLAWFGYEETTRILAERAGIEV